MKNTFGNSLTVTIFGESHQSEIGTVIDGIAPGIIVDNDYIAEKLTLRRPTGEISTKRHENDDFRIVSGVYNGRTTGTPIAILIKNSDTNSDDYSNMRYIARPGHADYAAEMKYHGFQDVRGGGHFSGRLTAAIVAAGAIIQNALEQKSIYIGSHIFSCAGVTDSPFTDIEENIKLLNKKAFAVLSDEKGRLMQNKIIKAAESLDSVGGIVETAVVGMPSGVGEPFFDSTESMLSHVLFSIPAVKGVEFGRGFGFADIFGSDANDEFSVVNGKIITTTNNNGGINGGITNGMPLVFKTCIKPTPSIALTQGTVNFKKYENVELQIKGRHDPAVIHRARVVIDSVTAIAIADLLALRFGTDWLGDTK